MAYKWLTKIGRRSKKYADEHAQNNLMAVFTALLGLLYSIPLVKRVGLFIAGIFLKYTKSIRYYIRDIVLNYMHNKLPLNKTTASPVTIARLQPVQQWLDRQRLRSLIDKIGDDKPLESYYVNGTLQIPQKLHDQFNSSLKLYKQAYETEAYEPTSRYIIHSNLYRISVEKPDAPLQKVRWHGLKTVIFEVDDLDPTEMYIWVIIETDDGTCSYPDGAIGSAQVLKHLFKISGFNREAFADAMNCTGTQKFLIYARDEEAVQAFTG